MTLRFNENRYREMSQSPTGIVGRFLAKSGARIESAAKLIATEEKLVRSGRYRSSIAWELRQEGGGLVLRVGSAVPHARLLEHGTPPHRILPRTKRALWWTHGADRGWFVPDHPLRMVQHPGTRPYLVIRRAVLRVLKGVAA